MKGVPVLMTSPVLGKAKGAQRHNVNVHNTDVNSKRPSATVLAPRWRTGLLRSAASRGAGIGLRSHRRFRAVVASARRAGDDRGKAPAPLAAALRRSPSSLVLPRAREPYGPVDWN